MRDPEVLDFRDDVTTSSDTKVVAPDVDILNIDYTSETVGTDLFLKASIVVDQLLVPPVDRSYRAYFAGNTANGLMDSGNQYFLEVSNTLALGTRFFLGVTDRRADGTTSETRISQATENISADNPGSPFVLGAPGIVELRVNVNRLDYSFVADGTPVNGGSTAPIAGDLVIGLSGRTREDNGVATSLLDETRGGSWIILGRADDGGGGGGTVTANVECDDSGITQFGGWQTWTTEGTNGNGRKGGARKYCRHVGDRGKNNERQRPFMEFQFPGNSTSVRYDYFLNPRGGMVQVFIDGTSRAIIDQYLAGPDNSGHEDLTPANRSFSVTPQANPHTFHLEVRTDLNASPRNIAYVDGFQVTGGAMGTAAFRDNTVSFTNTLEAGEAIDHKMVADLNTILLSGVVEPTDTKNFTSEPLALEIYNPAGVRITSSIQRLAPESVWASTLVPGTYTVRVRNNSDRAVAYRAGLIKTERGF
jgi:hypothetical protein